MTWPSWESPAPLKRPDPYEDLIYPYWFNGLWEVNSIDLENPDDKPIVHYARFNNRKDGKIVSDRVFNTFSLGKSLLGEDLIRIDS